MIVHHTLFIFSEATYRIKNSLNHRGFNIQQLASLAKSCKTNEENGMDSFLFS